MNVVEIMYKVGILGVIVINFETWVFAIECRFLCVPGVTIITISHITLLVLDFADAIAIALTSAKPICAHERHAWQSRDTIGSVTSKVP